MPPEETSLKSRTARSLKWNVIDRISCQALYAVTGIILARELSQEAFGLVGAILIFQAFASLFIDSGFSYALLQRKRPTELDYSSVFWFNLIVSATLYALLWVGAPLIADCFGGDVRLIGLSRVMFLSIIVNAMSIVQTNRLMKMMDVKPIAIANAGGLAAGGVAGIWLAIAGYGAWAIVWQTIAIGAFKGATLWIWCRWVPLMRMSWGALRSFFRVGWGMMMTSLLNTIFLNIYSFFIGNRAGLVSLGYYTQADKWSKMGVTAITQVLTSSFLPTLAEVQDDTPRFRRIVSKMNRFTAYMLFPSMIFLMAMATPIFHLLFGEKWDPSIILFRLLLLRGVFAVLNTLMNNYMLSVGDSRKIFRLEIVRDVVALAGIVATLPFIAIELPGNPTYGLTIFMAGQVVASAITWVMTLVVTTRSIGMGIGGFLRDMAPYFISSAAIGAAVWAEQNIGLNMVATLLVQAITGVGAYVGINALFPSKIQREVMAAARGKGFSKI